MSNRRPFIAGNWKLNCTRESAVELALAVSSGVNADAADIAICPVSVHLSEVSSVLQGVPVALGAQNCSVQETGAYTGEVSAPMLAQFGCEYIIVGHSERRALFHESSELVASKCVAVQQAGLTPIFCVGETLEQREAGAVASIMAEQLDALIALAGVAAFENLIVAYEPVWAIGTGVTASPEQAQEVHHMIRDKIAGLDKAVSESLRIVYGGSVKPDNAATLFSQKDIDGGLIGGAALNADSFVAICNAASARA